MNIFRTLDAAALAALREAISDMEYVYLSRAAAALVLGERAVSEATEALLAALDDEETRVRSAAAQALGYLGDPRAVEPLQSLLEDDEWDVWVPAGEALARLGHDSGFDVLVRGLEHDDPYAPQRCAARSWEKGDPTTPAIDPDEPLFMT